MLAECAIVTDRPQIREIKIPHSLLTRVSEPSRVKYIVMRGRQDRLQRGELIGGKRGCLVDDAPQVFGRAARPELDTQRDKFIGAGNAYLSALLREFTADARRWPQLGFESISDHKKQCEADRRDRGAVIFITDRTVLPFSGLGGTGRYCTAFL